MAHGPPAKRQRTSVGPDKEEEATDSEAPAAAYVKGDPWLYDGNVVLVAGKTAFRVFRSVLSKNSPVFEDMFTIPQPPDAETFEDCSVVHLQDAAHDVDAFLRALFDTYVFSDVCETSSNSLTTWL